MDDASAAAAPGVRAVGLVGGKTVRLLKNYMEVTPGVASSRIGLDPGGVYSAFKRHFPDWPKTVGGQLAVYQDGAIHQLATPNRLFGWMQTLGATIDWRSDIPTAISKGEFMAYVELESERFDSATRLPHFPPLPGVLYLEGAPAPVPSGALDELLSFFLPATDMDRDLLKAAFLTPFWGGPGGQRPAFVLTAKESDDKGGRGVGKTTVVDVLAELAGGLIEMSLGTAADDFKKRLLTSSGERIIRLDNVKAAKLSSADLESLITAPYISGHLLYRGEGKMPNMFTYFITFNDVSFSRDMAQRAIPIVLNRPDYDGDWLVRVSDFVAGAKDRLLSDIAAIFATATAPASPRFRFARWAKDVLGRVCTDPDIAVKILAAQKGVDDDDDQAEIFHDVICRNIRRYHLPAFGLYGAPADPESGAAFMIRKTLVYQWLQEDLKLPRMSNIAMSKLVARMRIPGLMRQDTEMRRRDSRCFVYWVKGDQMSEVPPSKGYLILDHHSTNRVSEAVDLELG